MRIWRDSSGIFRVQAEFLGLLKIHGGIVLKLHKANSVRITVPIEEMSNVDITYISSLLDLSSDSLFQTLTEEPEAKNQKSLPNEDYRHWVDRLGLFGTDAKLLGVQNNKAILRKVNGVKIEVPIRKLSIRDQEYVQSVCNIKNDRMEMSSSSSEVEMSGIDAIASAVTTEDI